MARYSAVLDIGKTNKKLLIFDAQLQTVASSYEKFALVDTEIDTEIVTEVATKKETRLDIEQFPAVRDWLYAELKKYTAIYDIEAISITTHGATIVFIDSAGDVTVPCLAYTSTIPSAIYDEFFTLCGDAIDLHKTLATPFLGSLLNYAICIFYARRAFPKAYAQTAHILALPSYFAHALTGIASAESTTPGCHSYMWDHNKKTWSDVATQLDVRGLLPAHIGEPADIVGCVSAEVQTLTGLPADCIVTHGIHDSNASLVPYLVDSNGGDFILHTTGTWCVSMSPDAHMRLSESDIAAQTYYNFGALGEPIKTAMNMGGCEHDTYVALLKQHSNFTDFPAFDHALYQRVLSDASCFIMPGISSAGPFPNAQAQIIDGDRRTDLSDIQRQGMNSEHFADSAYMYAALNISLALQTYENFIGVGITDGLRIYTEGGFRKNAAYNILLAALCPDNEVVLSNLNEATAFGAALLNTAATRGCPLAACADAFTLHTETVPSHIFAALEAYRQAFIAHAHG